MEDTKKCPECNRVLPYSNFYRKPDSKDGRMKRCKKCVSSRIKELNKSKTKVKKITDLNNGDWMTGGLEAIYY